MLATDSQEAREHKQRICRAIRVSRRVGVLSIEEQKRIHAARSDYDWLAFRAFVLRQRGAFLTRRVIGGRPYLMATR